MENTESNSVKNVGGTAMSVDLRPVIAETVNLLVREKIPLFFVEEIFEGVKCSMSRMPVKPHGEAKD